MKTVGIIGGLGPETTSEFYLQLVFKSYRFNKTERPPILIWSVPLDYKIEEDLIKRSKGEDRYLPYLIDAAKRLQSGGADFIVIPCNSVHIFIDQIRASVDIPVLSIIEESINFLANKELNKIGLLATQTTLNSSLYQDALQQNNIDVVLPNGDNQQKVGELINNLVVSRDDEEDKKALMKIINDFKQDDVDTILLACTDLQLLTPNISGFEIYDSMEVLVDAAVREIIN